MQVQVLLCAPFFLGKMVDVLTPTQNSPESENASKVRFPNKTKRRRHVFGHDLRQEEELSLLPACRSQQWTTPPAALSHRVASASARDGISPQAVAYRLPGLVLGPAAPGSP